jgi:hypothetical protein
VPDYANDPVQSYAIDERMKQLGRADRYLTELSKSTTGLEYRALRSQWRWATSVGSQSVKCCSDKRDHSVLLVDRFLDDNLIYDDEVLCK